MEKEDFKELVFDINELINFYDQKVDDDGRELKKHASSITGIIGEDLLAGLFKHYLMNSDNFDKIVDKVRIEDVSIKASGKKGKMLDRWIIHTKINEAIAYQTEIKNWSAHSIGGKCLRGYSLEKVLHYGFENFNKVWAENPDEDGAGGFKDNSISKVFLKMNTDKYDNEPYIIKPLVCFWMPVCDNVDEDSDCFYFEKQFTKRQFIYKNDQGKEMTCNSILGKEGKVGKFKNDITVGIFSGSIYLRMLRKKKPTATAIKIWCNNIQKRIDVLNKLIVQ